MRWAFKLTLAGVIAAAPWSVGGAAAQSVTEAVEAAIAYHPQIRRDQALAVAADHSVEEAYSDYLPDLDAEVSTGLEITSSPTTRGAGRGTVDEHRSEGRVTFNQLVFDFYETSNRVASARHELRSSHAELQATTETIGRSAIGSYLDVLLARELVSLAEGNVADHVALVDLIRGRADAGRAAAADLDQAISRLALVRAALVGIQGQERLSSSRYTETVGSPPGDLVRPDEPDYDQAADLDSALATAMDRNPLAHATSAEWDARRADVDVARSAYFPRFDVAATGGLGDNLDGVRGTRTDVSVLLRMQWNLFSGFGDLAATREATQIANAASRSDAEARRAVREAVRIAFRALQTAENRLPALRRDVSASRQTFEAYRQQYDLGQRTLLDLLDARDEQFDSEADLLNGEYAILSAHYDLLFAMGVLLEDMGILVYEPELEFDERGEGIHAASLTIGGGEQPAEGAVQPEGAAEESLAALPVVVGPADWDGEIGAGLPGVADYGFWLGGDLQRSMAVLDDEESAEIVRPTEGGDAAVVRREIAEIEVEAVPEMAALPEADVAVLPSVAHGELDDIAPSEFQDDALVAPQDEAVVPLEEEAEAVPAEQPLDDQEAALGSDRFGMLLEDLAALPEQEEPFSDRGR